MDNARSEDAALDPYFVTDLHAGYTFRDLAGLKTLRLGLSVYNLFNEKYFANGYAGAGYTVGADGQKHIYRYAGYAAQAPVNLMGTVSIIF